MKILGIVGAGGHGREVMPLAREMLNDNKRNNFDKIVFIVENSTEKVIGGY
ncbi:hypothetical protein [Buttiauxella gaviniae]|uniref:hypothetical protein n=1 Tax=Buttiauxella gaviniae TaxID=82990 RepID=UPI003BB7B564